MSRKLAENTVHIWHTELPSWRPQRHKLLAYLSRGEIARGDRLIGPDARWRFLISRGLIRSILGKYQNLSPAEVHFHQAPGGKPLLTNAAIEFNLSHSGDRFICAVALNLPVGIDIQEIYPIVNLSSMLGPFFSPAERAEILSQPADIQLEKFFRLWVVKEACWKAAGSGMIPPDPTRDDTGHTDRSDCWVAELPISKSYKAAAAARGPVDQLQINPFHPENFPLR